MICCAFVAQRMENVVVEFTKNHHQPTLSLRDIVTAVKKVACNRKVLRVANDATFLGRMTTIQLLHYLTDPWISSLHTKERFK